MLSHSVSLTLGAAQNAALLLVCQQHACAGIVFTCNLHEGDNHGFFRGFGIFHHRLRDTRLLFRLVAAHIANNTVRADQLPTLIREVHRTLSTVGEAATKPTTAEPAVEVKKSVFADHLVCLACGGSFKTLKWHLMSDHELTSSWRVLLCSLVWPLWAPVCDK